jgi:hypothetical protein
MIGVLLQVGHQFLLPLAALSLNYAIEIYEINLRVGRFLPLQEPIVGKHCREFQNVIRLLLFVIEFVQVGI